MPAMSKRRTNSRTNSSNTANNTTTRAKTSSKSDSATQTGDNGISLDPHKKVILHYKQRLADTWKVPLDTIQQTFGEPDSKDFLQCVVKIADKLSFDETKARLFKQRSIRKDTHHPRGAGRERIQAPGDARKVLQDLRTGDTVEDPPDRAWSVLSEDEGPASPPVENSRRAEAPLEDPPPENDIDMSEVLSDPEATAPVKRRSFSSDPELSPPVKRRSFGRGTWSMENQQTMEQQTSRGFGNVNMDSRRKNKAGAMKTLPLTGDENPFSNHKGKAKTFKNPPPTPLTTGTGRIPKDSVVTGDGGLESIIEESPESQPAVPSTWMQSRSDTSQLSTAEDEADETGLKEERSGNSRTGVLSDEAFHRLANNEKLCDESVNFFVQAASSVRPGWKYFDSTNLTRPTNLEYLDCPDDESNTIIGAACQNGHWTLVRCTQTPAGLRAEHWDPLGDGKSNNAVTELVKSFLANQQQWSACAPEQLSERFCPLQNNLTDCGVIVSVISLYLGAGESLPATVDTEFWREVLIRLQGGEQDEEEDGLGKQQHSKIEAMTRLMRSFNDANDALHVVNSLHVRAKDAFNQAQRRLEDAKNDLKRQHAALKGIKLCSRKNTQAERELSQGIRRSRCEVGFVQQRIQMLQTLRPGLASARKLAQDRCDIIKSKVQS
ncbi:uncharacterized protein J3D65DRAFT_620855, partial [Phyllosticta citribraziliensis]